MFHVEQSQSDRDKFTEHFKNVPRGTFLKLDRYAELLAEWNGKFNLVAESTIPHIWNRHFLDSAQLMEYIPKGSKTLADMGSGAGFPGLVLSIMGFPETHLIESTGKKVNFLRAVIDEFKLNAIVHQERVENMRDLRVDIVTARALKSLPELLKLAQNLTKQSATCLFLKGQNAVVELTESQKSWTFSCDKRPSLSDPSGSVLILRDIKYKHAASRRKNSQRN